MDSRQDCRPCLVICRNHVDTMERHRRGEGGTPGLLDEDCFEQAVEVCVGEGGEIVSVDGQAVVHETGGVWRVSHCMHMAMLEANGVL